ncbi:hypothetical protein [Motilibacter aurantiacus]|uniref:hypothetical protein n=1 Tax=Motilibacter aurantiacus TaxID=2714955 RepID=UPI0014099BB1|nr:hypothetical protein [Motilibacter aurantiacus]NHC43745.1 hypothetical protein [Motilibacter aurantiacus]
MKNRVARLTTLTALLVPGLAAACGQAGKEAGVADAPASEAPPDSSLVLRVDHTGGFVTPQTLATRLPLVSVYADGRVITAGPQTAVYPGPALPNLVQRTIAREDVDELVELALAKGVAGTADLGRPGVTDMPSTRFTVVSGGRQHVLEAYALVRDEMAGAGLTDAQEQARAELLELVDALSDLPSTLGPEAAAPEQPYVATSVAAVSAPWVAPGDALPAQPAKEWPGPALPGEPVVAGDTLGCVTATGDQAAAVLAAAQDANATTPWSSGAGTWSITLRPLLPDEAGCTDLMSKS